jgi:hypothetical protein
MEEKTLFDFILYKNKEYLSSLKMFSDLTESGSAES